MSSQEDLISQFCAVTGASVDDAVSYLTTADWQSDVAVANYFETHESGDATSADASGTAAAAAAAATAAPAEPAYTGPRTLDGRPAPESVSSSSAGKSSSAAARKPQQKKKGLMTMSSLKSGGGDHGHDHDDEDDEDEEDEGRGRGDLFAGGEKSGLAVQDPTMGGGHASDAQKVIRDIVAKAKANRGRAPEDPEAGPSEPSSFRGTGQTLGGEGVASRTIPDPATAAGAPTRPPAGPVQERTLHVWADGFSIDDGPLHRFDDPLNRADLDMIRQGRAPLHLMNVLYDQPVDVKLNRHQEEWHQLPRIYRPFGGQGRRLGSPVPGESGATATTAASTSASTSSATPASSATTATTTAAAAATTTVDESQPTIMVRVQLPDGTRLPARFNTTQTIGDVYAFVERAFPAGQSRTWVLATTFPNKDHTDRSLVLGETAEFKRGGAAVVKWV